MLLTAMYRCCTGCVLLQYLPDFKFWTAESSQRYAKAKDYPDRAREAIKEMHRQVSHLLYYCGLLECVVNGTELY
jgi:uncharacterized Fe-S radical SAM superfamily protein PflX